jgi:hypothetical protein
MLDGQVNTDRIANQVEVRPSIDGIAEIRVTTNVYPAELGRATGGVVSVITKSGTNEYHGTLYEYFRNQDTDAANFFALHGSKPEYRLNQFGGSIGMPIRKNKTFFFADYEAFYQNQDSVITSTIPTVAMKAGNFAGVTTIYDPNTNAPDPNNPANTIRTPFPTNTIPSSRVNPIAADYMKLYPTPNLPGLANNYTSALLRTQDQGTGDWRVDQRISDSDYFFVRYSYNDTTTLTPDYFPVVNVVTVNGTTVNGVHPGGGIAARTFPGTGFERSQGLPLNWVHIFRPTLLLEVRLGYTRRANHQYQYNYGQDTSSQFGVPGANRDAESSGLTLMSPSGYEGLGVSQYTPTVELNNIFNYTGALTWTKGSHSMKTGATLIRRQVTFFQCPSSRGYYTFNTSATNNPQTGSQGNAIASWLIGVPYQGQLLENLTWPGIRMWEPGVYFQDDWRVNRSLTLNLGIRYDIYTPFTEVRNRISNFDQATNKIVVAGVNGVSRSAGVETFYRDVQPRFGFAWTLGRGAVVRGGFGIDYIPQNGGSSAQMKNPPFTSGYAFTNDSIYPTVPLSQGFPPIVPEDPNNPTATMLFTALNYQPARVMQYNLTLQKDFLGNVATVAYVASLQRHGNLQVNIDQPLPGPGNSNLREPYYNLYPNILTMAELQSVNTTNYHSMQTGVERRLRRRLTVSANYVWAHCMTGGIGAVIDNFHLNHASCSTDVTQRGALSLNYQLPFAQAATGVKRVLVGGWQTNLIAAYSTGLPFTVSNSTPRANVNPVGVGGGTISDNPNRICNGTLSNPTLSAWFNTACFVGQPLYTAGTSGLAILRGPPLRHVDVSLFKEFPVKERIRLQFRTEVYNMTNTPNFANPSAALGSPSFGTISSTVLNANPRQFQFALKLLF